MHLLHQHYLIKTEDSIFYFFYLNKDKEIQYSIYNADNILLKEEKLVVEIVMDFAVTIDIYNQIHLIYITKSGILNYYIGLDTKWKHKILTRLDVKFNIYRYFSLLVDKNYTHIFYTKSNLLNTSITSIEHMYWNEKNINKTTITTYMPGKYSSPYQIDIDSMGNIHIIYKVFYKSNHQIFYNKFNLFNKKWENSEMVSNLQEENSHPNMLIDRRDNLHLVWCTITNNNFILKYKNKMNIVNKKSKWSDLKVLPNTNANNLSPILLHEGSVIKILSKQNNSINEVISNDYGLNWRHGINQNYKSNNTILIQYASNHDLENQSSKIKCLYGDIKDSIYIFNTNLFREKEPLNILELTSSATNDPHNTHKISEYDKKSFDKIIYNIESHINTLIDELEKLLQTKEILEKNPFNHEKSNVSLTFPQSKEIFTTRFLEINQTLTTLGEEKIILEEELNNLQKQFYIIENKIHECQNNYAILEKDLSNLDDANLGFLNKIINFFK